MNVLHIIIHLVFEVGFEMESYTVDEVTGRLEVNISSPTPFPGPKEVVLTMTTADGTAEGNTRIWRDEGSVYACTIIINKLYIYSVSRVAQN